MVIWVLMVKVALATYSGLKISSEPIKARSASRMASRATIHQNLNSPFQRSPIKIWRSISSSESS